MRKFKIAILIIVTLIGIELVYLYTQEYAEDIEPVNEIALENDIEEFKSIYENYNDEILYDNEVLDLELSEEAVVYISTPEEIVEVLKNEDAIVYFGFPTCPWCRNMLEAFIEACVEKDQEFYYVDISEIRNTYTVEDGLIVESSEGTDAYYELLELLDGVLSEYMVYDEDGEEYNTNTKRLYAPSVVTVVSGVITDFKSGTLEEVSDPYTKLSDEQFEKLVLEYSNVINNLQSPTCTGEVC